MKQFMLMLAMLFFGKTMHAQYTVNGNATRDNCHCYTLTPDAFTQSGSVWNNFKIDLTQSFDFNFDINLGCVDGGADGIVFVLQPISTSVGSSGGGLGYAGITPSVGVTIDTWQNTDMNDPVFDHIGIQLNGNIDHASTAANLAGPVTAIVGNDDIEDCQWHTLRIQWDAATKILSASIDGQIRVSATKDLVSEVFLGNPEVFWGFTGSTGGAKNLQQFCTALSPKFNLRQEQKRCINEPITFFDSTISFTAVQKRYWDFGDGSPVDSLNFNPVHTYAAAGEYTVTQTVTGADGCVEINSVLIKVGSIPIAQFTTTDGCLNTSLQLTDGSSVTVGTINQWKWDLGSAGTAVVANPTAAYSTTGPQTIKLQVISEEGCESAIVTKTLQIYPSPVADFSSGGTRCQQTAVNFINTSTISAGSVTSVNYTFGNGQQASQPDASTVYDSSKTYTVVQTVTSNQNCISTKSVTIDILPMPEALFNYSVTGCVPAVVAFYDSSLTAAGSPVNGWNWDLGNGVISQQQNPSASYPSAANPEIKLQVRNSLGCFSNTLVKSILLPALPFAKFGYAPQLCEGPVKFFDSSTITAGSIQSHQWIVNNEVVSNEPNPVINLNAGNQTIRLVVTSESNCPSTPSMQQITINPAPAISMQFADVCKDSTVQFRAFQDTGNAAQSWEWAFGDNTTSTAVDTVHMYSLAGKYAVQLTATNFWGCTTSIDSIINVYSTNANAGPDTLLAAANQPIQLNATGGEFYQWSPSTGLDNASVSNPVAVNSASQVYLLKAYSNAGCPSFDTLFIRVLDGPQLYVPTAFSPNGDTKNEVLRIWAPGITRLRQFSVFNRLGQLVFSTNDTSRGWDGTFKGKPQPTGVYVWIASGKSFRGNEVTQKGTVLLIR